MSNMKTTDKVILEWSDFSYKKLLEFVEKLQEAKKTREFIEFNSDIEVDIYCESGNLISISFTLYNKVEKTKEELEKERIKEKSRIEEAIKWLEKQLENYKNKLDEYNRASE